MPPSDSDSKSQILSFFTSLLDDWPYRRIIACQASHPPAAEIGQVPYPRIVLPLRQTFAATMRVQGESQYRRLDSSTALFAPPMGWTQEDWKTSHSAASLVLHPGYNRFIRYDHPGHGQRLPQPQLWVHSARPASHPARALLEAISETASLNPSQYSDATRSDLVRALLGLCLDELAQEKPASESQAAKNYQSVLSYLEENLSRPHSRQSVADAFGWHPNHLSRLFRQASQSTFSQTLNRLRTDRARHLLRHTSLPIEDVSALCGFSSASYFIKFFRHRFHATPQNYRACPNHP